MEGTNRKRARRSGSSSTDIVSATGHEVIQADHESMMNKRGTTNSSGSTYLSTEISSLKAELERMQSLRRLEKMRSDNTEARLKRHIVSLEADAEEARTLAEEVRCQSEADLERMSSARKALSVQLRECESRLRMYQLGEGDGEDGDGVGHEYGGRGELEMELEQQERSNELLVERVAGLEAEVESLRERWQEAELRAAEAQSQGTANVTQSITDVDDGVVVNSDNEQESADDENGDVSRSRTPRKSSLSSSSMHQKHQLSPAPPAVMTELNKTRVKLAEAQRLTRQQKRKIDELASKASQLVQYREKALRSESKAEGMEEQLKHLRKENQMLTVVQSRWTDFRKEIMFNSNLSHLLTPLPSDNLSNATATATATSTLIDSPEHNAPPEIATILRNFRAMRENTKQLQETQSHTQSQLEAAKRRIQTLETQLKEHTDAALEWTSKQKDAEKRAALAQKDLQTIQAQELIWRREADSLRALLSTYKDVEDRLAATATPKKTKTKTATPSPAPASSVTDQEPTTTSTSPPPNSNMSNKQDPNVQGLQLSLESAREQIQILRTEAEELKHKIEELETDAKTKAEEHDRVLKKFGMLREALYKEREKAETAEERACRAETLAGKGSFCNETTQVLHLKNNPLTLAIREKYQKEIRNLEVLLSQADEKIQALESSQDKSTTGTNSNNTLDVKTPAHGIKSRDVHSSLSALDAQKLNKRLKESFREQIGLFREGVYLLTGYKVDMMTDGERPRFKVRSVYAEREDDHLDFMWPKLDEGESPDSLDILDTEMAQLLSKEPACFDYMTKFKSLPAFMASVTLTLFEKQTFVE